MYNITIYLHIKILSKLDCYVDNFRLSILDHVYLEKEERYTGYTKLYC